MELQERKLLKASKDFISILIAVKNEEQYLDNCIKSLINQNFPQDMYRLVVIDGLSTDQTLKIASEWQSKYSSQISVCNNPLEWQASGRNIGMKNEVDSNMVAYIDGHCIADKNWLKNLYHIFNQNRHEHLAGVGSVISSPIDESNIGQCIDYVFSTMFGGTGSSYKPIKNISEVNTAPYALYLKSALKMVNYYDEDMKIGEDFCLNFKLRMAGLKILANPTAIVYYYKRSSILGFFNQMFNYGIAKAIIAKKYPGAITPFHYIPSFILMIVIITGIMGYFIIDLMKALILGFGLYALIILCYGIIFSLSKKTGAGLFLVPIVFITEHLGYSGGFLVGLFKGGWER